MIVFLSCDGRITGSETIFLTSRDLQHVCRCAVSLFNSQASETHLSNREAKTSNQHFLSIPNLDLSSPNTELSNPNLNSKTPNPHPPNLNPTWLNCTTLQRQTLAIRSLTLKLQILPIILVFALHLVKPNQNKKSAAFRHSPTLFRQPISESDAQYGQVSCGARGTFRSTAWFRSFAPSVPNVCAVLAPTRLKLELRRVSTVMPLFRSNGSRWFPEQMKLKLII